MNSSTLDNGTVECKRDNGGTTVVILDININNTVDNGTLDDEWMVHWTSDNVTMQRKQRMVIWMVYRKVQ